MIRVTSRDVAAAAGVSQSTVSRALRGDPRVAADTREHVTVVATDLGYRPHALARGLVTQTTRTIGLVVSDLQNPFYPALLGPLHDTLELAGYRAVLYAERTDVQAGLERLSQILDGSVDGLIFTTATLGPKPVALLSSQRLPIVLLVRKVDGANVDVVVADNVAGGRMAAEYLLSLGHRRIGLVFGAENTSTARDRELGFRAALADAGVACCEDLRRSGTYSYRNGYQSCCDLLATPDPPTALFCGNDVIAFGALDAAYRLGLRVPRDLSILGFDDIPMAGWGVHGLTTIRQPFDEMARAAVRLLLERLNGTAPNGAGPRSEIFPVSLMKRETAGPPPERSGR